MNTKLIQELQGAKRSHEDECEKCNSLGRYSQARYHKDRAFSLKCEIADLIEQSA